MDAPAQYSEELIIPYSPYGTVPDNANILCLAQRIPIKDTQHVQKLRAKRLAKQICSGINISVALLFKPSQITSYISIGSQCT